MEDYEAPDPSRETLRMQIAGTLGGLSCAAIAFYPVAEVWPRYATGTSTPPVPFILAGITAGGYGYFRKFGQPRPSSELPPQDSA